MALAPLIRHVLDGRRGMVRRDDSGGEKRNALLSAYAAAAPDVAGGVRAAVVMLVPFYLASSLGRRELVWTALGGWLGTLVDPGGSRATRARALSVFGVLGAVAVAVMEASARSPWLATIALAGFAFAAALARAAGATAGSVGSMVMVVAVVAGAGARTTPPRDAVFFMLGAAQAALLSSVVWPVWMHLPVRRAIAGVYRALAAYADAAQLAASEPISPEDPRMTALVALHHRRIREAIEAAREVALSARVRRRGESRIGSNVRALLGMGEAQFPLLGALVQEVQALPRGSRGDPAARLAEIAAAYEEIARVLAMRAIHRRAPARRVHRDPAPAASASPVSALAARLASASHDAIDLAYDLESPLGTPLPEDAAPARDPSPFTALREGARAVRDALSSRSIWFRHGLRLAVVAAAASAAGAALDPRHGYWVTLTALVVLQPHVGATIQRAFERVLGTLLGGVVAVAIAVTIASPVVLAALMIPLSVAAVATRPRSYRLFTFFLTPVFVLLAERHLGDWETAAVRVGDSAVGGALALAAGVLLLRSSERERLPEVLEEALDAVAAYARRVLSPDQVSAAAKDQTALVRRAAGVALSKAEESLERLLAEPLRDRAYAADAMLLVTYARHLSVALLTVDTVAAPRADPAALEPVARYVAEALAAAKAVARGNRAERVASAPEVKGAGNAALVRAVDRASLLAGLASRMS